LCSSTDSTMTRSMSHGVKWTDDVVFHPNSPSVPGVCVWTSFSTYFWSNLFLLWEWIYPSIDQQCSQVDTEDTTPETLYVNQTSSLNRGDRWFCSYHLQQITVTSRLLEEVWSFRGWKHHERRPWPRHQNDTVHSMLLVTIVSVLCVLVTKTDYGLHCHLLGAHNIHKHLMLRLHLVQILAPPES
jgi:hypothetical protein